MGRELELIVPFEHIDVRDLGVAVDHAHAFGVQLVHDALDLGTELGQFLLADRSRGVDAHHDLAHGVVGLAAGQVQTLCDEAAIATLPREVVVAFLGHEAAEDVAPREHRLEQLLHEALDLAREDAGLLGHVRGLRHGDLPLGLLVVLLGLRAAAVLAVGAVLDAAVAARIVVLLILPAAAIALAATVAATVAVAVVGVVRQQGVDVLGGHAVVLRIGEAAFGQIEAGVLEQGVDALVAGLIPLLLVAIAATRVVEHGRVHDAVGDEALHLGQRHLVDVIRVVADGHAITRAGLDVAVLDHLEAQGECSEERMAHHEVRAGLDHLLFSGHYRGAPEFEEWAD